MTSVLDAIVKLPRYIRVIDIDNHHQDPNYERQHAYFERNREKLLEYYHERYLVNKKDILQKKGEYNKLREVKARSSEYHKNYYLQHKEELKLKHREYSKNRKRKNKKQVS